MKSYKRLLAAGMVASMVLGNSVLAFAADEGGETSGSGQLDIVEQTDIFKVEVPVIPENDTTFNYILDPTGVIKETNAEKYAGKKFAENQTLYFANAKADETDTTTPDYSNVSDKLTVTNKSTMDVTVKVTASIEAIDGITMADSATFAEDVTNPMLYLALKDDVAANADKAIKADTPAEFTATVEALADAYETKYKDGKYVKELKSDATGFKTYSFQVTGACNAKGDWAKFKDAPPKIDIVWSIKDPTVPEVTGPQVTLSAEGLITISNLTADANIGDASKDLTLGINGEMYPINTKAATWITDEWTAAEGGTLKAQLNSPYAAFNGKEVAVSVKLSDGTTITCSETVTIAEE